MRNKAKVDHSCDEISGGVSLLEDAGRKATRFDGEILECRGRGETPDATHGDTE